MLQTLRSLVTSLAIASTIGSVAQAYASSATQMPSSSATMRTSGLAVEAVDYQTEGASLRGVSFRVSDPAVSVRIRVHSDGQWFACSNSAGNVSCKTPNVPVAAVDRLEITTA